jgi:hypothetical protein
MRHEPHKRALPRLLKIGHTAFVATLVPTYWRQYGPGNFLWFSDVALLTSVPALWLESRVLSSTQAAAVLVPESVWAVDYASGLLNGKTPVGLATYMFDGRIPAFVRSLSLFHLWLTPLLVSVVARRGYDARAFRYQTFITWAILLASWRMTDPRENVNWVHSRPDVIRTPTARAAFVVGLAAAIPLGFILPAHLLLKRLFGERSGEPR